jgi:hypothetical protein
MDKSREIQMKQHVLEMLKNFMMGEEGSKFKPKAIQVEMIGKPKESLVGDDDMAEMDPDMKKYEESQQDRFADKYAAADEGMSEKDYEDSEEDEAADEEGERDLKKNPRMSLRDFLASRSE